MLDKIKNAAAKANNVRNLAAKSAKRVDINAAQAKLQSAKNIKSNIWKD